MMNDPVFTPEQLKQSTEFAHYQDIITVVTEPDQTYTKETIRNLISEFCNKEVQ